MKKKSNPGCLSAVAHSLTLEIAGSRSELSQGALGVYYRQAGKTSHAAETMA